MDDQDRVRALEIEVARLIDRCTRVEQDRIRIEADAENYQRDTNARIMKLELWQRGVVSAAAVVGLFIGFLTNTIAAQIKSFFHG